MQCVIICAGKGTRMRPLTETTPKPMVKVCGEPILSHIIRALPPEVDELILVVGYLKEQIMDFCGKEIMGKKVSYVTQENFAGGTGDALMYAKERVRGKFLFLFADDIHGKEALQEMVSNENAILCAYSEHPERFGVITKNEDGTLREIFEKPENPTSNFISTGVFVAHDDIFSYEVPVSSSGELYATDILTAYAKDHKLTVVEQKSWIPIGYPENIIEAEAILCPSQID